MARKKREPSGRRVMYANIRYSLLHRQYYWGIVFMDGEAVDGAFDQESDDFYDTALAAGRSLVNALKEHGEEFR